MTAVALLRRPLAILAAVAVTLPSVRAVVDGHLDPTVAATRFLVALSLAWIAGAGIDRLVSGYARPALVEDEPGEDDGEAPAPFVERRTPTT